MIRKKKKDKITIVNKLIVWLTNSEYSSDVEKKRLYIFIHKTYFEPVFFASKIAKKEKNRKHTFVDILQ